MSHNHSSHDHPSHDHSSHHHSHSHGSHHAHLPTSYNRAFVIGFILNIGFVGVEALYGVLTHSLA